ncbi:unnamed protein product, partial [Ixodes hexagonus]
MPKRWTNLQKVGNVSCLLLLLLPSTFCRRSADPLPGEARVSGPWLESRPDPSPRSSAAPASSTFDGRRPVWRGVPLAVPSATLPAAPAAPRKKEPRPAKSNVLPREKKPNIILVLTDDQDIELGSMDFMPKTMEILGKGGAHFPHAYVSTPMCCPSRSSLLTGLYAHNHQVHTNNDNCSSPQWQQEFESRSFATYLSSAGYRTAYFGKYLNEYNGNHIPTGWREWAALVRNSRFYNYTVSVNGHKRKHGEDYAKDYYPDLVANESLAFLRQSKQLFPARPVMMVVSFPSPHGPEDSAPQYQHLFHNITTHRTPSWNYAPNQDKQWLLRYTGQMEPIHIRFTDMLHTKRLQTLQTVDDAIERLYKELVSLGELDSTYIFYTSDHGYHLGQFGLVKGKSMPFEFDIRVPFYVRGPKVPQASRIKEIVLNIDLAPTFLDIAGVEIPEHMDGKSIFPILTDAFASRTAGNNQIDTKRKKPWRDTFLIERGKVTKEHIFEGLHKSTRERNVHVKCMSGRHPSPCLANQKWECVHDGVRWHMRRCRVRPRPRKDCVCSDNDDGTEGSVTLESVPGLDLTGSAFGSSRPVVLKKKPRPMAHSMMAAMETDDHFRSSSSKLTPEERKQQRRFLREHVGRAFRPVFMGVRARRRAEELHEGLDLADDSAVSAFLNATVEELLQEEVKLFPRGLPARRGEAVMGDEPKQDTLCGPEGKWCLQPATGTPQRQRHLWRHKKERIDAVIRRLRQKLEELKDLRKTMKKKKKHKQHGRPKFAASEVAEPTEEECDCREERTGIIPLGSLEDSFGAEPGRRTEEKMKRKERKFRRKSKFENTTCNLEKMNCFTHDNNHWKTPPFWTFGPFCFCQNANNNTFWCLRTINDTHNFLYCEFITGFTTFYDMTEDPYQLRNAVHDLPSEVVQELHVSLERLKRCKGSKECQMRYRGEGKFSCGL